MTALVLTITFIFGILLMAFLGHITACWLENSARQYKEDRHFHL